MKYRIITPTGHETKDLTRRKAIRQKCLECCAWQSAEVMRCPSTDCALFPYRLGYKLDRSVEVE